MIRVSVLYQNAEDKKFDMAYYINKHMPMVKQKLGSACKRVDVDQGLGGAHQDRSPRSLPWRTWFSTLWTHFKRHLGLTRCHHGRHSKLHGYSAGHSAQRSENVGCGGLTQGRTDGPPAPSVYS